jgi:plasmid stabilization system protein ParE
VTVSFTAGALADLDQILAYTREHHAFQLSKLEERIHAVIARIERRPRSAPALRDRRNVRAVPLIRYPFKIYFREVSGGIETLHIYHTSRNAPL